jgi:hypothetical protein
MPGIADQLAETFGTAGAVFFTAMILIAACNPASDVATGAASCVGAVGLTVAGTLGAPGMDDSALYGDPGAGDPVVPGGAKGSRSGGSLAEVNPGGYTDNCGACAIATDNTLAGHPTQAGNSGLMTDGQLESMYGSHFDETGGPIDIGMRVNASGHGARGIVFAWNGPREWVPGTVGHFFNVANQNGNVRFLDGQSGGYADLSWDNYDLMMTVDGNP